MAAEIPVRGVHMADSGVCVPMDRRHRGRLDVRRHAFRPVTVLLELPTRVPVIVPKVLVNPSCSSSCVVMNEPTLTAELGPRSIPSKGIRSPYLRQYSWQPKKLTIPLGCCSEGSFFEFGQPREGISLDDHDIFSERALPSTHYLTINHDDRV